MLQIPLFNCMVPGLKAVSWSFWNIRHSMNAQNISWSGLLSVYSLIFHSVPGFLVCTFLPVFRLSLLGPTLCRLAAWNIGSPLMVMLVFSKDLDEVAFPEEQESIFRIHSEGTGPLCQLEDLKDFYLVISKCLKCFH